MTEVPEHIPTAEEVVREIMALPPWLRLMPSDIRKGFDLLAMAMLDKPLAECNNVEVALLVERQQEAIRKMRAAEAHSLAIMAESRECGCLPTVSTLPNGKLDIGNSFITHNSECRKGKLGSNDGRNT